MKEWATIRGYLLAGPQSVELDGEVHERAAALDALDRMQDVCVAALRAADGWDAYQRVSTSDAKAHDSAFEYACRLVNAVDDAAKKQRAYGEPLGTASEAGYAAYFGSVLGRFKSWLREYETQRWIDRNEQERGASLELEFMQTAHAASRCDGCGAEIWWAR